MIHIRADQMEFFSKRAREQFEQRMVTEICQAPVGEGLSESQVREEVLELISYSENHRIDDQEDVQQFIHLFFRRPPEILQDPKVKAILDDTAASGSSKIAFLYDLMITKPDADE